MKKETELAILVRAMRKVQRSRDQKIFTRTTIPLPEEILVDEYLNDAKINARIKDSATNEVANHYK